MSRTFLTLWRATLVLALLGSATFSCLAWREAREARELAASLATDLDSHDLTRKLDYTELRQEVDHINDVTEVIVETVGRPAAAGVWSAAPPKKDPDR
jgi:hypothetical protein